MQRESRNKEETPICYQIKYLASLLFNADPDGNWRYQVNKHRIKPMLEFLEDLRSQTPQGPADPMPLALIFIGDDDCIHYLFDWLLMNHSHLCRTLCRYWTEFSFQNIYRLPANPPLYQIIPVGVIEGFYDDYDEADLYDQLDIDYFWAIGDDSGILSSYRHVDGKEQADRFLGYVLAYIKERPEELPEILGKLVRIFRSGPNVEESDRRFQKFMEGVPWWKYKLRFHEEASLFPDVYLHHLFGPARHGTEKLGPLARELLDLDGIAGNTLDLARRLITTRPAIPTFSFTDVPHYPRLFVRTMKTMLLIWNRLLLQKDIIRNVLVHYILWNCYRSRDETIVKLEANYIESYEIPLAQFHRTMIGNHLLPCHDHNSASLRHCDYALLGSGILPLAADHFYLLRYISQHFLVRSANNYLLHDSEIAGVPKELAIQRFKAGEWVLVWTPSVQFQQVVRYNHWLQETDEDLWTWSDVAKWLDFGDTPDNPPLEY